MALYQLEEVVTSVEGVGTLALLALADAASLWKVVRDNLARH